MNLVTFTASKVVGFDSPGGRRCGGDWALRSLAKSKAPCGGCGLAATACALSPNKAGEDRRGEFLDFFCCPQDINIHTSADSGTKITRSIWLCRLILCWLHLQRFCFCYRRRSPDINSPENINYHPLYQDGHLLGTRWTSPSPVACGHIEWHRSTAKCTAKNPWTVFLLAILTVLLVQVHLFASWENNSLS